MAATRSIWISESTMGLEKRNGIQHRPQAEFRTRIDGGQSSTLPCVQQLTLMARIQHPD